MALEETRKLSTSNNQEIANRMIAAGWTLVLLQPVEEEGRCWVVYHLAWQREGEPVDVSREAPAIQLGAHATQP